METISKFNIADYLDSNEMIVAYLNEVLESGNDDELLNAIGNVVRGIGMTKVAEQSGLSGSNLISALHEGSRPEFSTVLKILRAVGGQIRVSPVSL